MLSIELFATLDLGVCVCVCVRGGVVWNARMRTREYRAARLLHLHHIKLNAYL